jgi:hypothetical protein
MSSIERFYQMAAPLVAPHGVIIAMKSKALQEELSAFDPRIESNVPGGKERCHRISVTDISLPVLELERSLVIIGRDAP